jgi:hypothetical protein
MPNIINRLSGKVAKTPSVEADPDRYDYINLSNVEPDLGVPTLNNAISTSNTEGKRVWVNLSDNFEVDSTSNLILIKIEAGTF